MPESSRLNRFRCSFRYKLFLIFTIMTALVACLLSTLYIVNGIRELRAHVAEQLRLQADGLAHDINLALYAGNREALAGFVREAARLPHVRRVAIADAAGRPLAEYRAPAPADGSESIVKEVAVSVSSLGLSVEDALNGRRESDPAVLGTVRLERGTSDLVGKMRRMILTTCLLGLAFWLAVSLLCYLVLRRVTASFNALMQGVERMRQGDYETPIAVQSADEPARAGRAINELATALRSRKEENRLLTQELVDAMEEERRSREELAAVNRALEREVAERRQAERAVRDSEQYLRRLMDAMPVGVAWSGPDGTVEYINDYVVERIGYERSELCRVEDWFSLLLPDPAYRQQVMELRREAIASAASATDIPSFEARVTCKDGMVRHVLVKYQLTPERLLAIFVDVTERELFLEQLVKTQKLESLGVLAGGIAHNFNNILTGVMGFISYARMFLDESHKAHAALGQAEMASRRAADMATQLLTFARGGDPVKRPLSTARLVQESLSLSLNGTSVRPVVELAPDMHAIVGDEGQLSQAFNNIIINAVQAMPSGGTLRVRGENVTGERAGDSRGSGNAFVRLSFIDQGGGIPREIIGRIFDPYYTTKSTGTGLGLASVHSIVQRHGGVVTVESEVGRGSVFSVTLPSSGEPLVEAAEACRSLAPGGSGGHSILVMDDEEMIREFARESLGFLGYRVTTCARGEEAVALYRAAGGEGKRFFAVILDLTIPDGMGGVEAARRILEMDPAARLIVSSGYSCDPVMASYRDFGFRAAVTKPYRVDQLGQELGFLHADTGEPPQGSRSGIEQKILASGVSRW